MEADGEEEEEEEEEEGEEEEGGEEGEDRGEVSQASRSAGCSNEGREGLPARVLKAGLPGSRSQALRSSEPPRLYVKVHRVRRLKGQAYGSIRALSVKLELGGVDAVSRTHAGVDSPVIDEEFWFDVDEPPPRPLVVTVWDRADGTRVGECSIPVDRLQLNRAVEQTVPLVGDGDELASAVHVTLAAEGFGLEAPPREQSLALERLELFPPAGAKVFMLVRLDHQCCLTNTADALPVWTEETVFACRDPQTDVLRLSVWQDGPTDSRVGGCSLRVNDVQARGSQCSYWLPVCTGDAGPATGHYVKLVFRAKGFGAEEGTQAQEQRLALEARQEQAIRGLHEVSQQAEVRERALVTHDWEAGVARIACAAAESLMGHLRLTEAQTRTGLLALEASLWLALLLGARQDVQRVEVRVRTDVQWQQYEACPHPHPHP